MPFVIAVGGVTCGGKTTLAKQLVDAFSEFPDLKVSVIHQDDYYFESCDARHVIVVPELNYANYDIPSSLNFEKLIQNLKTLITPAEQEVGHSRAVVIVEGNLIFENADVIAYYDLMFFLDQPYDTIRMIRPHRCYDPPDPPGYFDQHVWPLYLGYLDRAKSNDRITILSGSNYQSNFQSILVASLRMLYTDLTSISGKPLSMSVAFDFVVEPHCGAVSTFSGTTRDNFEGKPVLMLAYDCYRPMAIAEMAKVTRAIRAQFQDVGRVCMLHRIGEVPIGETSVVIAVSSAHRKAAIQACAFAIDELKAKVPIWKQEKYADSSNRWKENNC